METQPNFEEVMKELEEIAQALEKGDLRLEQAVEKFEKGMRLSAQCKDILDTAEKKITMLVNNAQGDKQEENFTVEA